MPIKRKGIQCVESVPLTIEEHQLFKRKCKQESLIRGKIISMREKASELIKEYIFRIN